MPDEQQMVASFPLAGVSVACEFSRQPTDTTPDAVNVRGFDTLLDRARGGSRPGLSKWVDEQVQGLSVVQHLTTLVDPTLPALTADTGVADPDTVPDPSAGPRNTWGRRVRAGGSGRQPNRNQPGSSAAIAFVQSKSHSQGSANAIYTFDLNERPNVNDLVVVCFAITKEGVSPGDVFRVNNGSNEYTRVGGLDYIAFETHDFAGSPATTSVVMFYRVANAGAADQTIRVEPVGTGSLQYAAAVVYRNAATAGPLSNKEKAAAAVAASTLSIPNLEMNGTAGQLVVAAFANVNTVLTAGEGYVRRVNGNVVVVDKLGVSGATPQSPTVNAAAAAPFSGMAAAFTK